MKKKNQLSSPAKTELNLGQLTSEIEKTSPIGNQINGHSSPQHRRRPKRSSINSNALLSTVASVHELMSFVIYKDHPPNWLRQTELYREYENKSQQINIDLSRNDSLPQYYQATHRKQRSNLHIYAQSDRSPQSTSPLNSRSLDSHSSPSKVKRDVSNRISISPVVINKTDSVTPLHPSVKQEPIEQNTPTSLKKSKSRSSETNRQRKIPCKKKILEISPNHRRLRHQRVNSVENQEPIGKKDSSSSLSSSQVDSNTSSLSSSSIEHASPSPTTTVSRSSSRRSSPLEYMRGQSSTPARPSSPLRIQTSLSPEYQNNSSGQRRSTRIWAPSSFYINPMWILPASVSSKRLIDDNSSSSPSPPDSIKRLRRHCRS